ncbi:MAG: tRNA pseudouridine(38-40) synthase TruA [Chloroflexi bacterium CFX4]|nr:tRNA pseudouridine(38-40) synthase TruA [Chloroflexi bacterium CFX4]MDL1921772.1 tRNA pseudouridine(38-40) synthase TruA [Chloroflexi bacterium CFX3]
MARYRAVIAYEGSAYHGFQRLRGAAAAPTVQGALEAALARLTGQAVAIVAAGRTDSGVHASGQVIAFDLVWQHSETALQNALNALLPDDIAVLHLALAADDFHPRYQAAARTYEYRAYFAAVRQPLLARKHWRIAPPCDLALMNSAAALLVGQHDFASFGTPPLGERGTTQRTVFAAAWQALPDQFGVPCAVFRITADAFLYRMVRAIVGSLAAVGQGKLRLAAFEAAFRAADRSAIRQLAPPHGLTLTEVTFRETNADSKRENARWSAEDEIQDLHTYP